MPTFVALLRGVNVGKAKRIPMAELRTLLAALGYTNVETLLNSGNAAFRAANGTSARHAANIAAAIASELKVEVPVVVKSARELDAIAAENPLTAVSPDHSRLLVAFGSNTHALASLAALKPLVAPSEEFALGKRAAYLYCTSGILESKAGAALVGRVGKAVTTRNWATVLKLQGLANEIDA